MSNCIRNSSDGNKYEILKTERENKDIPSLNRYTVKRISDSVVIQNYPGYLLLQAEKGK